jgi:preprotein translocase subunit SecF
MELFRNTKFDFLGWKWPFIGASVVLLAVGMTSLAMRGGPLLGIDFRGGAVMNVRFAGPPPVQQIRSALSSKVSGAISVTNFGESGVNEVLIGTEVKDERALNAARDTIVKTLETTFAPNVTKLDFNNVGQEALANGLRDPLQLAGIGMSDQQLADLAKALLEFRNTPPRSGLIRSFDELSGVPGVTSAMIPVFKQELSLAPFAIRQAQVVGPKVGADLRWQAVRATLYALAGMLVYIAFRFEWIYGVAAVVAVFHDTLITIGLFSLFSKEIDLTVVAALLTLVGYSMNDTIVVFDRIRENLKILKRMDLAALINLSVNQTLSRTVLTSGLTFLTAASLFLFGGPVLNGFAFALVVGIIIGTYSSVFVAGPILVFWQDFVESRAKSSRGPAGKDTEVRSEQSRGAEKPKARKG